MAQPTQKTREKEQVGLRSSIGFLVAATMLCLATPAFGQTDTPSLEPATTSSVLSSLPLLAHSFLLHQHRTNDDSPSFSGSSGYSYLVETMPLLMPVPLYSYDMGKGLLYSGAGLGLYGAASMVQSTAGQNLFSSLAYQVSLKLGMESTYEMYRDLRLQSTDPEYRDFKGYSFREIVLAPFSGEAIANPINLVIVPLYALGFVASNWEKAQTESVFATGRTYIDDTELNPWLATPMALATSAGFAIQNSFEEAYWRGFLYEEMKYGFKETAGTLNWLPASVLSSALFAVWHGPIIGWSWNLAGTFVLGLVIDAIYETGGLPAAGAGHGLANAAVFLLGWSMTSGVPKTKPPQPAKGSPVSTSLSSRGISIAVSLSDFIGVAR